MNFLGMHLCNVYHAFQIQFSNVKHSKTKLSKNENKQNFSTCSEIFLPPTDCGDLGFPTEVSGA